MKGDIIIPISIHRTHNRNRSLSFINSDQLVSIHRKGISLNYTKRVHKESRVTYEADLTIFSYNCRVFCSP
jgi:hypothetical protein